MTDEQKTEWRERIKHGFVLNNEELLALWKAATDEHIVQRKRCRDCQGDGGRACGICHGEGYVIR